MGLFNRDKDVCKGKFGMVEDDDGNVEKGIEMSCPGEKGRVVVKGDKEEAEKKAKDWLEDKGKSAKIRDQS